MNRAVVAIITVCMSGCAAVPARSPVALASSVESGASATAVALDQSMKRSASEKRKRFMWGTFNTIVMLGLIAFMASQVDGGGGGSSRDVPSYGPPCFDPAYANTALCVGR